MQLFFRLKRDNGRTSEISAMDGGVYEVVRQLAIEVGVIQERKTFEKRASTIAIEKMMFKYRSEHGLSRLADDVRKELRILHKLLPDRVLERPVCMANDGIACKHAIPRKCGLRPLCGYGNQCGLSRLEAV